MEFDLAFGFMDEVLIGESVAAIGDKNKAFKKLVELTNECSMTPLFFRADL